MRKIALVFFVTSLISGPIAASEESADTLTANSATQEVSATSSADFRAFTGKISRDKVRMRLQASLDSPVIREMQKGEMIIAVGETEDFYAVQPPRDIRGYIYRTLVLDNVIEGNRVNVRLQPNLDAPTIAQLNAGDQIEGGVVSASNNKWMEILPPKSVRFFISRDYIEKVGDAQFMATFERRQRLVNKLSNDLYQLSKNELSKPFDAIQFESVVAGYNSLIQQYSDFPAETAKAKELLAAAQDEYLKKKVAYLEEQNLLKAEGATKLNDTLASQQQRLKELESQVKSAAPLKRELPEQKPLPAKMAIWIPIEETIYQSWCNKNGSCTKDEFYSAQLEEGIALRGVIEPYSKSVKNKPGDYVLLNANHLPFAYLYSTQINLQDYVGHEVTVLAVPRPNNQFAFPAYFALEVN